MTTSSHAPDAASASQRPTSVPEGTMRAVVQHAYGSADVLSVADIERPTPGPSQVLVAVEAAGVDRGVWHLMNGTPALVRLMGFGLTKPKQPVPGLDVAGRVVAVGAEVTRFAPGDEVLGVGVGTFAQLAVAEESKLVHKPAELGWESAGVLAISGLTALQAVVDVGRVQPGQRVLVTGASGGVGTYAVQIASALGAQVTGVCSAAKADLVRELGATDVADYRTDDYADGSTTYDLILSIGDLTAVRRLRRALKPSGTLVVVGGEGGGPITNGVGRQLKARLLSPFVSQRLTGLLSKESHVDIERLAAMAAEGQIRAAIDRVVDLDGVAEAMRDLEAGTVRGKIAVRVA